MRLLVVSTNLNRKKFWRRWKFLRDIDKDIEIFFLVPSYYEMGREKAYSFGQVLKYQGQNYDEDRFHVRAIDVKEDGIRGWYSKYLVPQIREINPDIIYYIGIHSSLSLKQVVAGAKITHSKLYVFTMAGDLKKEKPKKLMHKIISKYTNHLYQYNIKNCDAIFVHYPDAVKYFRSIGYTNPIFINTQIGVDTSYFKFDSEGRNKIRKKYNIENAFVFGSASRLSEEKGILDGIKALPRNDDVKYMILGNGSSEEIEKICEVAKENGVERQIILPGLIGWEELPEYLSAFDCALHIPKRTSQWVETFSLALVQEMSTELPVIGSRSGSVPYQIGRDDLLVAEGNIDEIKEKMLFVINHKDKAIEIGKSMRERCINCFDVEHIARCLDIVLNELQQGIYNRDHIDTAEKW